MDWTAAERRLIEAQYVLIEERFGERLDAAGREVILARLLELHRQTVTLRQTALTLADEPLPPFAARSAGR